VDDFVEKTVYEEEGIEIPQYEDSDDSRCFEFVFGEVCTVPPEISHGLGNDVQCIGFSE
jgi:hypothetical protein